MHTALSEMCWQRRWLPGDAPHNHSIGAVFMNPISHPTTTTIHDMHQQMLSVPCRNSFEPGVVDDPFFVVVTVFAIAAGWITLYHFILLSDQPAKVGDEPKTEAKATFFHQRLLWHYWLNALPHICSAPPPPSSLCS